MFTTSTRVSRLSAFAFAVVMAASLQGALLWSFDTVSQDAALACRANATPVAAMAPLAGNLHQS